MTIYRNTDFRDQTISLDGNGFFGCRFTNCTIIYAGGVLVALAECKFEASQIVLDEPARNTAEFIGGLISMRGGFIPVAFQMLGVTPDELIRSATEAQSAAAREEATEVE